MKKFVTASVCALLAASMTFASAGAAGAAPNMSKNTGQAGKDSSPPSSNISGNAVVDSDGTLNRGLNAKSVTHSTTGEYVVYFNSNIRKCAYVGSVGLSGTAGISAPGYLTVVGAGVSSKAVYVVTYDSTGTESDLGFHLVVNC